MDGRAVSTGGLPALRTALGMVSYPPQVLSVRAARRFVQALLAGTALQPLADDAGLLVSELAANAVLHARSDFDVAVHEVDGGVRVSVRDRSQVLPVLIAPSATAMSGRGLALVQTLASQWGAGASPAVGKSVWFELHLAPTSADGGDVGGGVAVAGVEDLSIDELLAAWSGADHGDEAQPAAPALTAAGAGGRVVVLPPLDAAALLAAKEHMDDLLRELQLVLLDERQHSVTSADDVRVARALDAAARNFDDVRRQVRQQVSRAVADGQRYVQLRLGLDAGAGQRAGAYRTAVEAAEGLAVRGELLSAVGVLRRGRGVREAYLTEVIAASQG